MGRALGQLTRSGNSGEPRRGLGVRILHVDDGKTVQFGGTVRPDIFCTKLDLLLEAARNSSSTGRASDSYADFLASNLALGLANPPKSDRVIT